MKNIEIWVLLLGLLFLVKLNSPILEWDVVYNNAEESCVAFKAHRSVDIDMDAKTLFKLKNISYKHEI